MFIFYYHGLFLGSILRRRHRLRVRPRSSLRPILCCGTQYGTPCIEVALKPFALKSLLECPTPGHLRAPIRPGVCYPTRHPTNVASSTKNPIVVVAIKVHDIELLKKSG